MINTAEKVLAVMAQVYADNPELFAQYGGAKNKKGEHVPADSNEAASFDAADFLYRMWAEGRITSGVEKRARKLLFVNCDHLYGLSIIGTNDDLGREAIIKACLYKGESK